MKDQKENDTETKKSGKGGNPKGKKRQPNKPKKKSNKEKDTIQCKRKNEVNPQEENKAVNQDSKSKNNNRNRGSNKKRNPRNNLYEEYASLDECLKRYANNDKKLVRGKVRTMPGGKISFLSCDRGTYGKDVLLDGEIARNRSMDGDLVYVEIIGPVNERGKPTAEDAKKKDPVDKMTMEDFMKQLAIVEKEDESKKIKGEAKAHSCSVDADIEFEDYHIDEDDDSSSGSNDEVDDDDLEMWQEDEIQSSLWNPIVNIRKRKNISSSNDVDDEQFHGRVIHVVPPKTSTGSQPSELNPSKGGQQKHTKIHRTIVGTVRKAPGENSNRYLFVPNSRCLPRFMAPPGTQEPSTKKKGQLYRADYVYGSWKTTDKWPPCRNLKPMGQSANIEDETQALLLEFGVDHGEFDPSVLRNVENEVKSGRFQEEGSNDLGWKPTPEMYKGRRDYRDERIFTIDPTTAKDLDDALHIKPLPDGKVEIGVHIADVSHFVRSDTPVDEEAARRTTTVYLVDRVIPMLPRPLCEIACSLNENVERLAFSCVWTMNMDGTLAKKKQKGKKKATNDVWYGRTVIKSCARLDYATAQNIIDKKCGNGEKESDEKYWPKSRQPTGGHTIDQVAHDVRLMHKVAMARRKLRFENGALALNGIKLTFQMGEDGQIPKMCEPYPIRDSNRLIEEYMLLANYLVAQRLITHAGNLAVLRHHMPPLQDGIQSVIDIAAEKGYELDGTSSQTLQETLSRMGRECQDKLLMQCITEQLMAPMRPAEYLAAGQFEDFEWAHFALNIPYYTHFTSPIRRYPDVLVHRLLQATLDGQEAVEKFPQSEEELQGLCVHSNDKRMASKKAQERSDRVFLSIFLKFNPMKSTLGVVTSIGMKAFTVFVPSIGVSSLVYLDEHVDIYEARVVVNEETGDRSMTLVPKDKQYRKIEIKVMAKLDIACHCKEEPPIDVRLTINGPYTGE